MTTIDGARQRLGGRFSTTLEAGSLVAVEMEMGDSVPGVVVFASAIEVDILIDGGVVHRTRSAFESPFLGDVPELLRHLAAEARMFAELREGERVRFEIAPGHLAEGKLAEKCRYGAIVISDDQRVLAVGFRKIWPLTARTGS